MADVSGASHHGVIIFTHTQRFPRKRAALVSKQLHCPEIFALHEVHLQVLFCVLFQGIDVNRWQRCRWGQALFLLLLQQLIFMVLVVPIQLRKLKLTEHEDGMVTHACLTQGHQLCHSCLHESLALRRVSDWWLMLTCLSRCLRCSV